MKKGIVKKLLLVLFPLAVFAAFALFDPEVQNIGDALARINPWWLVAALGSIIVYYLFDTFMYMLACKYMHAPQKFGESILTTMLGFFYSALTPFASGGQPLQILQMRRRGIKVGIATSVIMVKFIAWQLVITVLGAIGFLFVSTHMQVHNNVTMLVMYCFGFLCYLATVILAVLVLLKPDWIYRVGQRVLGFLARRRILKRSQTITRANETWTRTFGDMKGAIRFMLTHKVGMLLIFLVCFVEAVAYMSVTYFIYRGFGLNDYSYLFLLMLSSFLHIAVSFIPLPGASVGSEGGFYIVFSPLFAAAPGSMLPAMGAWRLFTYYSALVFGVVAVIVDGVRNPKTPENQLPNAVEPALESAAETAGDHAGPIMPAAGEDGAEPLEEAPVQ